MRVFQNNGTIPAYKPRLEMLARSAKSFRQRLDVFLHDRYVASHILLPVYQNSDQAFYTNGDDEVLQRAWAAEQGLPATTPLDEILLAQIEAHRTEVFYNLDPMRYGSSFIKRLPGCVLRKLAWRAAPSAGADFSGYDVMISNFPGILAKYEQEGLATRYFWPSHDPVADEYNRPCDQRDIDVVFVGGYSRHHLRRAAILESLSALRSKYHVRFHLDKSRLTRIAESPLGWLPIAKLRELRRPTSVRAVSADPIFGRDMYTVLGQSKIVFNCAVGMAGEERGNMRCFEALGCGSLMVSDEGKYPAGMVPGETLLTYRNADDVCQVIETALQDWTAASHIAQSGAQMLRTLYSKERQWELFQEIVASL